MGIALGKLAQEDPSFRVHTDEESGQTIISGMGELHLDIIVDRMRREFKVEANIGKPQVAYREKLKGTVEANHKFAKQSGGRGQYGHVVVEFSPADDGEEGLEFINEIVGGVIPQGIHSGDPERYRRADEERRDRRLPAAGSESSSV